MGGHPGPADDRGIALLPGALGEASDLVGRAVSRQHLLVDLDAELAERLDGRLHLRRVVGRPHQDGDLHARLASSAMSWRWCMPGQ